MRLYRSKTPDTVASPLPCPAPLLSVGVSQRKGVAMAVVLDLRYLLIRSLKSDPSLLATILIEETCSVVAEPPQWASSLPGC